MADSGEAELEPRDRRVLAFVAVYRADEGCLPSPAEIAVGCGMRSPTTARRALQNLERFGYIERDASYPRLGRVRSVLAESDLELELWLIEVSLVESYGNLEAIRKGLAYAPDLDAREFLHREATARLTLTRAYLDARRRLRSAGVTLSSAAEASLATAPSLVEARHELFDDWTSYCLYSAMMTWASHRALAGDGPTLGRIEPIHAAELEIYDPWDRLDRRVVGDRLLDGDVRLVGLCHEIAEHIGLVFAAGDALYPEHFATLRSRFDESRFLAECAHGELGDGRADVATLAGHETER